VGIEILLGAIELHPDDVNLHDSLGEFYAEIGLRNEAILAYQKALSLNPQYPNSAVAKARIIDIEQLIYRFMRQGNVHLFHDLIYRLS